MVNAVVDPAGTGAEQAEAEAPATAQRLTRARLASGLARVASLGYAVPGTVLAVGLLSPLAGLDNMLDAAARQTFGVSTGLLISGSGAALV